MTTVCETMIAYHAVMIDETGCEFGVTFEASGRDAAHEWLEENYPESRCDQLEDADDRAAREAAMYHSIMREMDGLYDDEDD